MRNVLSSKDYRRLFPGQHYPKRTEAAASELVARGLKATASTLDYLVSKGVVQCPNGEGRNRQWQPWHIMQAAKYLEEHDAFTPEGWRWVIEDVDPAQDIEAFREASRHAPHLPYDPGYFIRTVKPGGPVYQHDPLAAPGSKPEREFAKVHYEPVSLDQVAEWRDALADAKEQGVLV